jgi:type IV pilus modification protein PilV
MDTRRCHGFTLIEVLVAVSVLGVVLLGGVHGLLDVLRAQQSAHRRSEAALLATDLLERIRANAGSAAHYELAFDDEADADPPACVIGVPCEPASRAAADLAEWRRRLEQSLPGARARVRTILDDEGTWRGSEIEVQWLEDGGRLAQGFALSGAGSTR